MRANGHATWTRRRFLRASLSSLVAAPLVSRCADMESPAPLLPMNEGLRRVAETRSCKFGAAVQAGQLLAKSASARRFALECSSLTPELAMKWERLAPTGNAYDFGDMDRIAQFARENGMALRGHTLLWHRSVPRWARSLMLRTRQWHHVRDHIEVVMSRYGAQVAQWDVVNEPLEIGGRPDGLRQNVFLEAYGPQYIDWAFWAAHDYAPQADRFINEYGLEYDTAEEGRRRIALLKLVEGMRSRGVPVTGVGLQAHLDLRKGKVYRDGIYGLVRDLSGMGLKVAVTELDVHEADTSLSHAERDKRVADETARYLDVVLDFPAVRSVSTWGLSDQTSWLRYGEDSLQGNRGLPYDERWNPKPMRWAISRAFGGAGRTT